MLGMNWTGWRWWWKNVELAFCHRCCCCSALVSLSSIPYDFAIQNMYIICCLNLPFFRMRCFAWAISSAVQLGPVILRADNIRALFGSVGHRGLRAQERGRSVDQRQKHFTINAGFLPGKLFIICLYGISSPKDEEKLVTNTPIGRHTWFVYMCLMHIVMDSMHANPSVDEARFLCRRKGVKNQKYV